MKPVVDVSMKRDLGRLIAQGLPSKLTFDQACMRSGIFSELYLHAAINEILGSNLSTSDFWIRAGHAHPALQDDYQQKINLGRSRELDFFVTPSSGRNGPSLAIEVKWTPSKHCTWKSALVDLYRLKLISMVEAKTDCMFVLCGPRTEIHSLLRQLHSHSEKRAIARKYPRPLVLRSTGSASGNSQFAPVDENGRFFGGEGVRNKLPLRSNGKKRLPTGVNVQLPGEATAGVNEWTAAAWRIS